MAFSSRGAVGGTTGRPVLVAFILDFWTGLVEDGDFSAPWDFDEATGDFSSKVDFVSVGLVEDCSPEALFFFPFFLDLDSWWLWGSVGVALGWWLGGGAVGVVCPDFGAGSCLWVVCFTPDWCEGVGASFSISFLLSDCFSKITWIFLSKVCLKKFSMKNYQWQKCCYSTLITQRVQKIKETWSSKDLQIPFMIAGIFTWGLKSRSLWKFNFFLHYSLREMNNL